MQKLIMGCGYLGRRVAKAWVANGHTVTALTRSVASADQLSFLGIQPLVGDVCDQAALPVFPEAETVLYAVGYDRNSGRTQHEVYVEGLRNVLPRIAGRCEKFVYISSSSVYGQSAGEWVDESSPCEPVQLGGQICRTAEVLVREFFPSTGDITGGKTSVNIIRLAGIYGPGRLLSRIESLRAGEPLSGRADAWLNLIHVDDAVTAVLACEQRGRPGQTYLITDDRPIRREEYYNQLARLVSAPAPLFLEEQAAKRGSGALNKRCSNQRARAELALLLAYPTITEGLPHALGLNRIPPASDASPSHRPLRQLE